jgi:hypothetical protein
LQTKVKELSAPAVSADKWAAYSAGGERWQRSQHINFLLGIWRTSKWRGSDIATALRNSELLYEVWQSEEFQKLLYDELVETVEQIENDFYDPRLAMHLKLFCHLSPALHSTR